MNRGFRSIQDQGKTLCMVATMWDRVRRGWYKGSEVYGNLPINTGWLPGYHYLPGESIHVLLQNIVKNNMQHIIVMLDEINRVFPARGFKENRLVEMLAFWQDQKLFNEMLYTAHIGSAVDIIIRDATQQVIVPQFNRERDEIVLGVINTLEMERHYELLPHASYFFDKYSRWGAVV